MENNDGFEFCVCCNIHVLYYDENFDPIAFQTWTIKKGESFVQFCMIPYISESPYAPCNLVQVLHFCQAIVSVKRNHPDKQILVLAGSTSNSQGTSVFLVGCHAILSGLSCEQVMTSFRERKSSLEAMKYSVDLDVFDFLRAFARSKELNWIGDNDDDSLSDNYSGGLNMEEYAHYARL